MTLCFGSYIGRLSSVYFGIILDVLILYIQVWKKGVYRGSVKRLESFLLFILIEMRRQSNRSLLVPSSVGHNNSLLLKKCFDFVYI